MKTKQFRLTQQEMDILFNHLHFGILELENMKNDPDEKVKKRWKTLKFGLDGERVTPEYWKQLLIEHMDEQLKPLVELRNKLSEEYYNKPFTEIIK